MYVQLYKNNIFINTHTATETIRNVQLVMFKQIYFSGAIAHFTAIYLVSL